MFDADVGQIELASNAKEGLVNVSAGITCSSILPRWRYESESRNFVDDAFDADEGWSLLVGEGPVAPVATVAAESEAESDGSDDAYFGNLSPFADPYVTLNSSTEMVWWQKLILSRSCVDTGIKMYGFHHI